MAEVTVFVTPYPGATTALELEEFSPLTRAWHDASSITEIEEDRYTATVSSAANQLRARWVHADGESQWFAPYRVYERRTPSTEQESQLKEAVIAKATRIYLQSSAALGYTGEISDLGVATVRPDYQIRELLHGLRWVDWDVDHDLLVTHDDVITQGLQADSTSTTWSAEKLALIDDAIAAAWHWVATDILEGVALV